VCSLTTGISAGTVQPSRPHLGTDSASQTCAFFACQVRRIGKICTRRMCRKHCRISGGCNTEGHATSTSTATPPLSQSPSTLFPAALAPSFSSSNIDSQLRLIPSSPRGAESDSQPSQSAALAPSFSSLSMDPQLRSIPSSPGGAESDIQPSQSTGSIHFIDLSGQPPGASSFPSQTRTIAVADATIKPRYVSQLRPIFVEHVAQVHEQAEAKRQQDQRCIQAKKSALERVIAFSFPKVCSSIL
jgi:hypothetical protein